MSGPLHNAPRPYAVRLSVSAQRQLDALPPSFAAAVQLRLNRLAQRAEADAELGSRVVQAQLIGNAFRAAYEVDHGAAAVTVLDVECRG